MRWVAPTEKDEANHQLEKRLWAAADQFRANSGLKAGEYSGPVLGLIFLRFAEARFAKRRAELEKAGTSPRRGNSRIDDPKAYMAEGVLYLTPGARFDYLLQRPEGGNVGKAVNEAMADIEKHNPQLAGVLLVLGWRRKIQSRAKIHLVIEDTLEGLPRAYTKDLFAKKSEVLFEHVYEAYQGDGASIYAGSP